MHSTPALSPRQMEILEFIHNTQQSRGLAPSVREICQHVNVASTTSVHRHLHTLRERGYLRMESQTSRSLQLTGKAVELFEETIRSSRSKTVVEREPSRGLVVVGRIAAGVPIDAIEDHERFDLANAFDPDRHFLLRVKGDSMIDAHIANGDLVVIRKQETCENGEVVAAVIEGETTLKRFYRRKNHIELQPANQRLKSLRVKSVEIRGVVVGVIRQMG